jgi:predicted nucleic acid-binding protein
MPFVVDASVAASWLLPDENNPEAMTALDRLKDDEAFVPVLLWFEIRNVLLMSERRQRITSAQTAAALNVLEGLPLQTDNHADSETTLQLARDHRLTVYDAAYLELAVRRRIPLLTFNALLAAAARRLGIPTG